MAYTELSIITALSIWYFDFQSADGALEGLCGGYLGGSYGRDWLKEFQLHEHITCSHNGPFLKFRVRKDAETDAQWLL